MPKPVYSIGTRVQVKKVWHGPQDESAIMGNRGTISRVTPAKDHTKYLVAWDNDVTATLFDETLVLVYLTILKQEEKPVPIKHHKGKRFLDILKAQSGD